MAIATLALMVTGGALIGFLLSVLGAGGSILLLPLVLGAAVGALVGQRLAPHLSEGRLRKGFAALLLGSALITGAEAVKRHLVLPDPATGVTSPLQAPAFRPRSG